MCDVTSFAAGCMAERLKTKILETDKMVDLVAGPGECLSRGKRVISVTLTTDSYRSLPQMLAVTETGQSAGKNECCTHSGVYIQVIPIIPSFPVVNVLLSLDETYADVMPVRVNADSPSAYM